jgi:hypothetical protein
MGFNKYSDLVSQKLSQLEYIVIPDRKIKITNIDINLQKYDISQNQTKYAFLSPWLALNQLNYQKYRLLDKLTKKPFLEKILVANILSVLKGLEIRIDFKILTHINKMRQIKTLAHENEFAGFLGEFEVNINLPNYLGIGKSVSKGFGVVISQIDS